MGHFIEEFQKQLGLTYETAQTVARGHTEDVDEQLVTEIVRSEPTPVSELSPVSPPELERIIRKCLEKDPAGRFQSGAEMCQAMHQIEVDGIADGDEVAPGLFDLGAADAEMAGIKQAQPVAVRAQVHRVGVHPEAVRWHRLPGIALPGLTMVCPDSHSCTLGGLGALAGVLRLAALGVDDDPMARELLRNLVEPALSQVERGGTVVLAPVSSSPIIIENYTENLWGRTIETLYNLKKSEADEFLEIADKLKIIPERGIFPFEDLQDVLITVRQGKATVGNSVIKISD